MLAEWGSRPPLLCLTREHETRGERALRAVLADLRVGAPVDVDVERAGEELSLDVVLGVVFSSSGRHFEDFQVHQSAGHVGHSVLGVGRIGGGRGNSPESVDLGHL